MNDKFKKLSIDLTKIIKLTVCNFLLENLCDKEEISQILNILMSSHISSLFTLMLECSKGCEQTHPEVRKFVDDLKYYISTMEPISQVETLQ